MPIVDINQMVLLGFGGVVGVGVLAYVTMALTSYLSQQSANDRMERLSEQQALALQAVTGINQLEAADREMQDRANRPVDPGGDGGR
jgi:ABC-type bacteriocin/lantibiotic exporter with double-glycine peptidase domain